MYINHFLAATATYVAILFKSYCPSLVTILDPFFKSDLLSFFNTLFASNYWSKYLITFSEPEICLPLSFFDPNIWLRFPTPLNLVYISYPVASDINFTSKCGSSNIQPILVNWGNLLSQTCLNNWSPFRNLNLVILFQIFCICTNEILGWYIL